MDKNIEEAVKMLLKDSIVHEYRIQQLEMTVANLSSALEKLTGSTIEPVSSENSEEDFIRSLYASINNKEEDNE